ncbi:Rho/RAC guanine nucleotide exchange factor, putative [Entamoeba invadens IP1]|uniref:Rho/RAC guanine nucleotide exchange factor, putative n=1 Tax=Entamoeba invadens IP1 TaxID=370355 RepID=A0A0A1UGU9_ENTIV|nr:Rho/RAC guanine nucleotide exchange factor, putative [Entamoeba invadens IP1]ELP95179.1 Rho/RAC guanine nucleotide exchange factor, putative [Entamoeba invadens IP1]|eukprot:XP_004261950.1 Rho/RAC guanine nucleotide exchange factor, putative [Entamoeba invadens IP1]
MHSPRLKQSYLRKPEQSTTAQMTAFYEHTFTPQLLHVTLNSKKFAIPKRCFEPEHVKKTCAPLLLQKTQKSDRIELNVDTLLEEQLPIFFNYLITPMGPPLVSNELFVALALLRFGVRIPDIFTYILPLNEEFLTQQIIQRLDATLIKSIILFDSEKSQKEFYIRAMEKYPRYSQRESFDQLRHWCAVRCSLDIQEITQLKDQDPMTVGSPQLNSPDSKQKLHIRRKSSLGIVNSPSDFLITTSPTSNNEFSPNKKSLNSTPCIESSTELSVSELTKLKLKAPLRTKSKKSISKFDGKMKESLAQNEENENYINSILYIQKMVRHHMLLNQYNIDSIKLRLEAFKEFVDTEKSLLKNMNLIKEHFSLPLASDKNHDKVFGHLDQCITSGESIVKVLDNTLLMYKYDTSLGSTIDGILEFMTSYLRYSIEYDIIVDYWKMMKQSALGQSTVNEAIKFIQPQTLEQLLVQPVQRVMRYPLLIDAIIKGTSYYNPDYGLLNKARKHFHNFCTILNERKKMKDTLVAVAKEHAAEMLVISGRFLIHTTKGELKEGKKKTPVVLEVCNDAIFFFGKNDKTSQLLKIFEIGKDLEISTSSNTLTLTRGNDRSRSISISFKKEKITDAFKIAISKSVTSGFYNIKDEGNWKGELGLSE